MYRIYERIEVSSAHRLEDYEGKCNRLHGHNYLIEVWVESEKLNKQNMVVDFSEIKKIIKQIDHKYLNEILPYRNPTAEVIASWVKDKIQNFSDGLKVKVRVWEDKDSYAEVE